MWLVKITWNSSDIVPKHSLLQCSHTHFCQQLLCLLHLQSWVLKTDTVWPTKPEIFRVWTFTEKIDNLCPRWFISLLALTQVNSKPESKLFGEIRSLFILGMFYLGTLIWVLIKLWKLSWTQSMLTCTLAELL